MEKVYEIKLFGAVEGGYVYAEQAIGLFPTLDDAKAFLASNPRIYYWMDSWRKFSVFERVVGAQYDEDEAPVYETDDVDWIGFDKFDETQHHAKWFWRVFDMLEEETNIESWRIWEEWEHTGQSFTKIARELLTHKSLPRRTRATL